MGLQLLLSGVAPPLHQAVSGSSEFFCEVFKEGGELNPGLGVAEVSSECLTIFRWGRDGRVCALV